VNDVVLIVDETSKRNSWPKGIVVDVHLAKDGQVRSGVVRTPGGLVTRPAVKLAKLLTSARRSFYIIANLSRESIVCTELSDFIILLEI